MVRKTIVLSAVVILMILSASIVWIAFADSAPLSSPVELQSNLPGVFGYSVYQLADGGLILNTANQTCTFLVRLDSSNQLLWSKPIFVDPANTTLPRLRPTSDGGFVLGGIMDNLFTVVKTDSEGNVAWTRTFSSGAPINYFQSIIQTNDGGYAIAGFSQLVDEGLGWIWFVKTDSSGNMQWNKTISGPLADCPSSLFQTPEGGYVLSDVSYSFNPNHAFFRLLKLDASGNVVSSSIYGGDGYFYQPECNFAIATKDGGYFMAGYLWQKNAWAVKTDADGAMQWNQTYGVQYSSIISAVENQNGYLLLSISNLTQVQLIQTDKVGNAVWTESLPGVQLPVGLEASFNSLIAAKGGGYYLVGSKDGAVLLAKLNVGQNGLLLPSVGVFALVAFVSVLLLARAKRKTRRPIK